MSKLARGLYFIICMMYVWFMKRNFNYRKMKRKPRTLPLLLTFVRGAIGKEYVIKHYRYGIIKTKYPDMSRIVASEGQRSCRDLFKKSVACAKQVIKDPVQKDAWLKKVRQKHRLFNQLVKHFMLKAKKAAKKREMEGKYLLRSCFRQGITMQVKPIAEQLIRLPENQATATAGWLSG